MCGWVQQQVGGAGIGFGNSQDKDDTMQTLYGDRSEFTKGADLGGEDLLDHYLSSCKMRCLFILDETHDGHWVLSTAPFLL